MGLVEQIGIPSLVLMERQHLLLQACRRTGKKRGFLILIICGVGNNGADGVAAGRMLSEHGYRVTFFILGQYAKSE